MPRSVPFRAVSALLSALVAGAFARAGPPPPPATLVSFTWSVFGDAVANASAECLAPPPCPGTVSGSCSGPVSSFAAGGDTLAFLNTVLEARRTCGFRCDCCAFGGGTAQGWARSIPIIADPSGTSTLIWSFRNDLDATAAAGSSTQDGCGTGSGTSNAAAGHSFALVFDLPGTTRLSFSRSQSVNVLSAGQAQSSILLVRVTEPSATILTRSVESTGGAQNDEDVLDVALPPGRYRLEIDGAIEVSDADPGGPPAGSAQCRFSAWLSLSSYACPNIDTQPQSVTASMGATATFSVAATGSFPSYRWRKDGTPLSNGPTGTGTLLFGALTPMLSVVNIGPADAGVYDCVVTNLCGDTVSMPANLLVCFADFNASGSLSVQDIFDFLGAYFSGDPRADVNLSGALSVQDIFDFLAAYFAGCGA